MIKKKQKKKHDLNKKQANVFDKKGILMGVTNSTKRKFQALGFLRCRNISFTIVEMLVVRKFPPRCKDICERVFLCGAMDK